MTSICLHPDIIENAEKNLCAEIRAAIGADES